MRLEWIFKWASMKIHCDLTSVFKSKSLLSIQTPPVLTELLVHVPFRLLPLSQVGLAEPPGWDEKDSPWRMDMCSANLWWKTMGKWWCHGISWDLMGFTGISWSNNPTGFNRRFNVIQWVLVQFHRIQWVVLWLHGIQWVLMWFNGIP